MTTTNECPCIDCISLAICRHKKYYQLFYDCSLLKDYEPDFLIISKRSTKRMTNVEQTLNPIGWAYVLVEEYDKVNKLIMSKVDVDGKTVGAIDIRTAGQGSVLTTFIDLPNGGCIHILPPFDEDN